MKAKCEGCHIKQDDSDFAWLCPKCQEAAASYDITVADKKELERVVRETLGILKQMGKMKNMRQALLVSRAVGRLRAGKERSKK